MFEPSGFFNPPISLDQKIWRYVDFTKFVDLLYSSELYFSKLSNLEDKYEGSLTVDMLKRREQFDKGVDEENEKLYKEKGFGDIPRRNQVKSIYQGLRDGMFVNCWHMNNYESAAMWQLYSRYGDGIAIQTTYHKWTECFSVSPIRVNCGVVEYEDYESASSNENFFGNIHKPFVTKRLSFEHEKEVRALISYNLLPDKSVCNIKDGGIKAKVNLSLLLENGSVN